MKTIKSISFYFRGVVFRKHMKENCSKNSVNVGVYCINAFSCYMYTAICDIMLLTHLENKSFLCQDEKNLQRKLHLWAQSGIEIIYEYHWGTGQKMAGFEPRFNGSCSLVCLSMFHIFIKTKEGKEMISHFKHALLNRGSSEKVYRMDFFFKCMRNFSTRGKNSKNDIQ